jgi:MoaA/NifB/PqqE/SkfB family radical SAM enzyme
MNEPIALKDTKFPEGCPKIEFYRHPHYYELTCSLFDKCNLNCEFCSQEHAQDFDFSVVDDLPMMALEQTREDFKKYGDTIKKLEVRFWGGELFSDNIPMSYFIKYHEFMDNIKNLFMEEYPWLELEFVTTTNGVMTKHERLKSFLKMSNMSRVSVSFDYLGRYRNNEEKQKALSTMKFLSDNGFKVNVGIILTKRSINYILSHTDEFLSLFTVYNIDTINFNFYIANKGWEVDMPSDEDLWSMYKFCIDNRLFGVKTLYYLFTTKITKEYMAKECECKFLPNFFKGGATKNCIQCFSNLGNKLFYGTFADELTEENVSDVKASLGVMKRGCLTCEHYQYCQMPCWSTIIFEHFQPTECPLKRAYSYITEDMLQEFEKWRNTNDKFR